MKLLHRTYILLHLYLLGLRHSKAFFQGLRLCDQDDLQAVNGSILIERASNFCLPKQVKGWNYYLLIIYTLNHCKTRDCSCIGKVKPSDLDIMHHSSWKWRTDKAKCTTPQIKDWGRFYFFSQYTRAHLCGENSDIWFWPKKLEYVNNMALEPCRIHEWSKRAAQFIGICWKAPGFRTRDARHVGSTSAGALSFSIISFDYNRNGYARGSNWEVFMQ